MFWRGIPSPIGTWATPAQIRRARVLGHLLGAQIADSSSHPTRFVGSFRTSGRGLGRRTVSSRSALVCVHGRTDLGPSRTRPTGVDTGHLSTVCGSQRTVSCYLTWSTQRGRSAAHGFPVERKAHLAARIDAFSRRSPWFRWVAHLGPTSVLSSATVACADATLISANLKSAPRRSEPSSTTFCIVDPDQSGSEDKWQQESRWSPLSEKDRTTIGACRRWLHHRGWRRPSLGVKLSGADDDADQLRVTQERSG